VPWIFLNDFAVADLSVNHCKRRWSLVFHCIFYYAKPDKILLMVVPPRLPK